jgi:hypothetical protein
MYAMNSPYQSLFDGSNDIINVTQGNSYRYNYTHEYKVIISLSLRGAAHSRCSRARIIQASQHVMIEYGLLDLCSYATPVVHELGGKGW